jgi:hypothetical protein
VINYLPHYLIDQTIINQITRQKIDIVLNSAKLPRSHKNRNLKPTGKINVNKLKLPG